MFGLFKRAGKKVSKTTKAVVTAPVRATKAILRRKVIAALVATVALAIAYFSGVEIPGELRDAATAFLDALARFFEGMGAGS